MRRPCIWKYLLFALFVLAVLVLNDDLAIRKQLTVSKQETLVQFEENNEIYRTLLSCEVKSNKEKEQ